MSQFRVLYTDRGDYSHDFSIERPLYDAIGVLSGQPPLNQVTPDE